MGTFCIVLSVILIALGCGVGAIFGYAAHQMLTVATLYGQSIGQFLGIAGKELIIAIGVGGLFALIGLIFGLPLLFHGISIKKIDALDYRIRRISRILRRDYEYEE